MSGPFDDDRRRPTVLDDDAFVPDHSLPGEIQQQFAYGHSPKAVLIAGGLFLATCVTTFLTGMTIGAGGPGTPLSTYLGYGASYAGPLMLILLCHEMGHYLQSRRYHVPATLPIFLPMPIGPLGTMGAVIVQAGGTANRKAMFDIAVSGPLAGLVIALPVAWWGIQQSTVVQFSPEKASMHFGDPLLLKAMVWLVHGPLPANHDVILNPLLYAGWVGFLLTGLNLLPIGQLDGGHIVYTLIGRRANWVGMVVLFAWIAYMVIAQYFLFLPMVLLLLLFGVRHPPTANDSMPLGPGRTLLGWATMALLIVCITPRPFDEHVPQPQPAPQREREVEQSDEPIINVRLPDARPIRSA